MGWRRWRARFERHDVQWTRPLWQQGRADLRTYLDRQGAGSAGGPTNADPGYVPDPGARGFAAARPLGIECRGADGHASCAGFMARSALEHIPHQEAQDHVTEDRAIC